MQEHDNLQLQPVSCHRGRDEVWNEICGSARAEEGQRVTTGY